MKADMAEGVAELVFDEEDLPHLHSIYPEITDYLEEKLTEPEWLADLNERLEGLAMAYEEDKALCGSAPIIQSEYPVSFRNLQQK